jgi:hypothetical protein
MRNLLAESMELSTTSYYSNEDGTKSTIPTYKTVNIKVDLGNGKCRYYNIIRSGFVGRAVLLAPLHMIIGYTQESNNDYWNKHSNRKSILYKDNESFDKAIKTIQKKLNN